MSGFILADMLFELSTLEQRAYAWECLTWPVMVEDLQAWLVRAN